MSSYGKAIAQRATTRITRSTSSSSRKATAPVLSAQQKQAIESVHAYRASVSPHAPQARAAASEITRYRAGDVSAPRPTPAPAGETHAAAAKRHMMDMYRAEVWLEAGPGKGAPAQTRAGGMYLQKHAYDAMHAARSAASKAQSDAAKKGAATKAASEVARRARGINKATAARNKEHVQATEAAAKKATRLPASRAQLLSEAPVLRPARTTTTMNVKTPKFPPTMQEYQADRNLKPAERQYPYLKDFSYKTSQAGYQKMVAAAHEQHAERVKEMQAVHDAQVARNAKTEAAGLTPEQRFFNSDEGRIIRAQMIRADAISRAAWAAHKANPSAATLKARNEAEALKADLRRQYSEGKSGNPAAAKAARSAPVRDPEKLRAANTKAVEKIKGEKSLSESGIHALAQYILQSHPDWEVGTVQLGHGGHITSDSQKGWHTTVISPTGISTPVANWADYHDALRRG